MVTSRSRGMARNFSCGYYNIVCGLNMNLFNNGFIDVGSTGDLWNAVPQFCLNWAPGMCSGGTQTSSGSASYNWTIGATSIIKASSSSQLTSSAPSVTGVSRGSGSGYVNVEGGGCQSGGSEPGTVGCPAPPTNDVITALAAYSATQSTFQGQLSGGSGTFSGWKVSEYSPQSGSDACRQNANLDPTLVPPNSAMVVNGTVGTVSSSNTYNDAVGWYPASVTYIRNNSPLHSNTPLIPVFPCGGVVYQALTALCPNGNAATDQALIDADSNNTLSETVYSTYVTNCKRGVCNTLNH